MLRGIAVTLCALLCVTSEFAGGAEADGDTQTLAAGGGLPASIPGQRVIFRSHDLKLVGILFAPPGAGPFPAILWNHGSERNPGSRHQFEAVARYFVPAGFVVFAPVRRGHGYSEGQYIATTLDTVRRTQGSDAVNREMVRLLESEHRDDELAGLSYLTSLKIVDASRLIVAGCSYGGIETLLAAEGTSPFKAAIAISPAALSWSENPYIRRRLFLGVNRINIPVLLLQPAKDASLEPSRVLGAEFMRPGKDFTAKTFPAVGPADEQKHCFGGGSGTHVWAADALAFIARVLR